MRVYGFDDATESPMPKAKATINLGLSLLGRFFCFFGIFWVGVFWSALLESFGDFCVLKAFLESFPAPPQVPFDRALAVLNSGYLRYNIKGNWGGLGWGGFGFRG